MLIAAIDRLIHHSMNVERYRRHGALEGKEIVPAWSAFQRLSRATNKTLASVIQPRQSSNQASSQAPSRLTLSPIRIVALQMVPGLSGS
jgi:hypothetical protein